MKLSSKAESKESNALVVEQKEAQFHRLASCQKKFKALQRRCLLLKSYLNEDPGIVYYDTEWGNLADKALLLWQQLQSIRGQIQAQLISVSTEEQRQLEGMIQELSPFLSSHYDAILNDIEDDDEQSRVPLAHLRADPLFQMYQNRLGEFKSRFNELNKKAIESTVKEISDYSRYLFLKMPQEEMLNSKSAECPHYLAITAFFNDTNRYAVNDILQYESVNARAAAYSHWVAVAQGLYEVGDFSSALSVCAALNSRPLTRLTRSISGVSSEDQIQLKQLNEHLKKEALNRQYDLRDGKVIPFMGNYRTELERIKQMARLPRESESKDQKLQRERLSEKAKVKLADTLLRFQQAVSSDATDCAPITDVAHYARRMAMADGLEQKLSDKAASRWMSKHLYNLSKQHEPLGVHRLPSRLLSYKKQSWLNGLRNRVLANVVLERKIAPPNGVSVEALRHLNEVVRVRMSRRRFQRKLLQVGIELDRATLKRVHRENKQLYYHNLIDNSALKNMVRGRTVLNSSWGYSTSRSIRRINRCLSGQVKKNELIRLLRAVNINLTPSELNTVIQEARCKRLSSPAVAHLEQKVQELESHLEALSRDAGLKKQLRDYMKIVSVDSLSHYDKRECLLNLTSVVAGNGHQHSGFNPDLDQIRCLVALREHVEVLSSNLTDSAADQLLAQKIQILNRKVNTHPLLNQHNVLERWCYAGGEPDDQLRSDIARLAKLGRRTRSKLASSEYLDRVILRTRQRTQQQLEPVLASRLVESFKKVLLPAEEKFLSCIQRNPLSPDIEQQLLSCVAAVKAASSAQDINTVKRQYAELEARLGSAINELKETFTAHQEAVSYVSKEFQLNCSLLKYIHAEPKRALDPKVKDELKALGFLTKIKRKFILGMDKTSQAQFVAAFAGVDPRPFAMVKTVADLKQAIDKLQAPSVESSMGEALLNSDNESSELSGHENRGAFSVLEEAAVVDNEDLNLTHFSGEQKSGPGVLGYQHANDIRESEAIASHAESQQHAVIPNRSVSAISEDSNPSLLSSVSDETDSDSDAVRVVEDSTVQQQSSHLDRHDKASVAAGAVVLSSGESKSVSCDNPVSPNDKPPATTHVNTSSKAHAVKPRFSYVECGAAVVGALVLAPVAVKVAGFALVGAAFKAAFAAKVTAGVVGVGAGMRLGVEVEQAAEKGVSRALGCLGMFGRSSQSARESKDSYEANERPSLNR